MLMEVSIPVEDAQDLRRQLKALEDKNMIYMQQNLDLEEVSPSCHVIIVLDHVIHYSNSCMNTCDL